MSYTVEDSIEMIGKRIPNTLKMCIIVLWKSYISLSIASCTKTPAVPY